MGTQSIPTHTGKLQSPLGAVREIQNPTHMTELTGLNTTRRLASQGAKFCKVSAWNANVSDPGKGPFEFGWQGKPYTADQVGTHLLGGGNVGLLTGKPSGDEAAGYILILDADEDASRFAALFDWVGDSPAIVREGPDRRKVLVRVIGEPPESQSFKRQPTERKPFFEVLSTGRQGVVAGRHPSGAEYRLINADKPIRIFTPAGINAICEAWAGQSLKVFQAAQQQERQEQTEATRQHGGDGLLDRVLEFWTPFHVFERFGRVGEVRQKGDELKLRGNGGLYVNGNRWYSFTDEQGGGSFQAWQYCKTGNAATPRGREFIGLLHEMATEAGIPLPEHKNGHGHQPTQTTKDDAGENTVQAREYLPFKQVKAAFDRQEAGDAELFAALYQDRYVYDHSARTWYTWKGHHWEPDHKEGVYTEVSNHVAAEYIHAAAIAQDEANTDLSKDLVKRAAALRTRKRIDAILFLAARIEGMGLTGEEWDANPWLLGCVNGTIDLHTGGLLPGRPADYIRTVSPVNWIGLDTPAPAWERFQLDVSMDDPEVVAFKARMYGCSISGRVKERIFPILYGEGGQNGKGTELETIGKIMGGLSTTATADVLMEDPRAGDRPSPFLYGLRGKRFVWVKESREGQRLNTGLVKMLSGGDTLEARENYMKRNVKFTATHTIFLMTNHKPHIPEDDRAMWKRVCLIPYALSFVDNPTGPNERQADRDLDEKLWAERSGILAWIVRGCLDWQHSGLQIPEKLRVATEEYRQEEDTLKLFEDERCYISPAARVRGQQLYDEYVDWCNKNSIAYMTGTAFGRKMGKRHGKDQHAHGAVYVGIGLISEENR